MELTDQEKSALLAIAKNASAAKINHQDPPEQRIESETLKLKRGAFVTLKKHGHLRGCIGYIRAYKPLWETVQEMAVAAAFNDPRFPSLRPEEIQHLTFEISVLTPFERVKDIQKIEVGKHGLYLVRGQRSGLLLPQVAIEYGWNRETFLRETCHKAGLPPDAWMDGETEIYTFSADYFGDTD